MDKKSLPLIILCAVLFLLWQPMLNFFWPRPPVSPNARATNAVARLSQETTGFTNTPVAPAPIVGGIVRALKTPLSAIVQTQILENAELLAHFTSVGGGIGDIALRQYTRSGKSGDHDLVELNRGSAVPVLAVAATGLDFLDPYQISVVSNQVHAVCEGTNGLQIAKEFTLKADYQIEAMVTLRNTSRASLHVGPVKFALGLAVPLNAQDTSIFVGVSVFSGDKARHEMVPALKKFVDKQGRPWESVTNVEWAAVKNQYFTLLATPAVPLASVVAETVSLPSGIPGRTHDGALAAMVSAPLDLAPGASTNWTFHLYAGPKEYKRLAALGQRQDLVLDFGIFEIFSKALLWMLGLFHAVFHNWGMAIVAVTVLIKTLFWPLTAISTRSMKQMQALAPKMNALKEKYKDDSKRMNEEMMKMYRDYRINPMAGCLPMVVQIPIFFAFYNMLRTAIELRGASFLWIHDLSMADTVAHLPVLGFAVNLMPLLMAATMIWQTRITPQAPNADPSMKMMMWMMPATFLFFCYNFSSGLSLYWTVQNLLTVLQTYLTRDKKVPPPQKVKPRKGLSFMRPAGTR